MADEPWVIPRIRELEAALDWIHNKFMGQLEDGPYDPPPKAAWTELALSRSRVLAASQSDASGGAKHG